jgi:hypothetical protein
VLPVGCTTLPVPVLSDEPPPRTAARLYVTRPWQAIPEPNPFIQGVIQAFTEELVLCGYDVSGVTADPDGDEELRRDLLKRNELIYGTVGIHLVFREAPVGFGFTFAKVLCVIYDADCRILLSGEFDPPRVDSLLEFFFPRPDVDGRYWGQQAWEHNLSFLFPPRG